MAEWEPVCGRCESFDTLAWETPPRVTKLDEEFDTGMNVDPKQTGVQTIDAEDIPAQPDQSDKSGP